MPQLQEFEELIESQLICGVVPSLKEGSKATSLLSLYQLDQQIKSGSTFDINSVDINVAKYPTYSALLKLEVSLRSSTEISEDLLAEILNISNYQDDLQYYLFLRSASLILQNSQIKSQWTSVMTKWQEFRRYPLRSNVLGWYYFEKLISQINEYLHLQSTTPVDLKTLTAYYESIFQVLKTNTFGYMIQFLVFYAYTSSPNYTEELEATLQKYVTGFLNGSKFPKATDSSINLDCVIYTLVYIGQKYNKTNFQNPLYERALEKSFQSIPIMKGVILATSDLTQLKGALKLYLEYIHSQYVQNGNKYLDLMDVIDTLKEVLLRWPLSFSLKDGHEVLKKYTDEFFSQFDIGSKSEVSACLKKKLSEIWFVLGISLKNVIKYDYHNEIADFLGSLELVKEYFVNSITMINVSSEIPVDISAYYFECSYALVKTGNFKEAIKYIKTAVKLNPTNTKYVNLLVLLYSSSEATKSKALDISSSLLEGIKSDLGTAEFVKTLSEEGKWSIMQFLMNHIALVEYNSDVYEALEYLPEFVSYVHVLFPKMKASVVDEKIDDHTNSSIRSSNYVLSKVKKSTKLLSPQTNSDKTRKKSILNSTKRHDGHAKKSLTLQECWLWCSTLYYKAGMFEDAESCLLEAEAYSCGDGRVHATLGLLAVAKDRHLALKEIESSLAENEKTNIEAKVALTILSLEGESLLNDFDVSLFTSKEDINAAIARSKIYLETLTTNYETFQQPEVYFYLSKIYEMTGNDSKLEAILWKCVELEDCRPIRPWSAVDYFKI